MDSISYLRSIKPKYYLLVYFILICILVIFISMFIFKSYDVYNAKAYYNCDDKCTLDVSINYLDVNKVNNIDLIKLNKENIQPKNISVSDIMIDEVNKVNYQIVSYEVDKLDDIILNTFIDVKLYSKEELIINKIVKMLI